MKSQASFPLMWKEFLYNKRNLTELIISVFLLAIGLVSIANFVLFAEQRKGVSLSDPILSLIPAMDLTWLIFLFIYSALLLGLYSLLKYSPSKLLLAIQVYALMVYVRVFCMWIVPLEPPSGMIILIDPFVELFGSGQTLTKDLFFSGHTATLLILTLTAVNKNFKYVFVSLTVLTASALIIQHVHYTIDIVAAIFVTFGCYYFINQIRNLNE